MSTSEWAWPYFSFEEMACRTEAGGWDCGIQNHFMHRLVALREEFGSKMVITSGYRTPEHNAKIGGSPNSYHMDGIAVDVHAPRGFETHRFVRLALLYGFSGIGLSLNGDDSERFIHIDTRPSTPVIFTYGGAPADYADIRRERDDLKNRMKVITEALGRCHAEPDTEAESVSISEST